MPEDWLAVVRGERDQCREQLRELEAERDRLRVELRDALGQVEHWRTLAEYREKMIIAENRAGTDRRHEHPPTDRRQSGADRRS